MVEAGLIDQTLFKPPELTSGVVGAAPYVPALGISVSDLLAFIVGHAGWSIGVPIAMVEALVPARRATPWLGRAGLGRAGLGRQLHHPHGSRRWSTSLSRPYWREVGVPEADLGIGADCIIDPDGGGPRIWFQVVPEHKTVKNRLHLDVHVRGGGRFRSAPAGSESTPRHDG